MKTKKSFSYIIVNLFMSSIDFSFYYQSEKISYIKIIPDRFTLFNILKH